LANFSTIILSEGNHTIYLKVQDDEGVWSPEVWCTLHMSPAAIVTPYGQIIAGWLTLIIIAIVIFMNIAGYLRESKLDREK